MRRYQVAIHLSHAQLKAFYAGSVSMVSALDSNGVRLQFPLRSLRPYVGYSGVHGRFELTVDQQNRLQTIERLS